MNAALDMMLHEGLSAAALAQFSMSLRGDLGLAIAVVLTFIGMALHWHLPGKRMSLEERMKDGRLTEEQVNGQIRFYTICAPLMTLAGVVMLIVVLLKFAE